MSGKGKYLSLPKNFIMHPLEAKQSFRIIKVLIKIDKQVFTSIHFTLAWNEENTHEKMKFEGKDKVGNDPSVTF
jgi:hypothetical protein